MQNPPQHWQLLLEVQMPARRFPRRRRRLLHREGQERPMRWPTSTMKKSPAVRALRVV